MLPDTVALKRKREWLAKIASKAQPDLTTGQVETLVRAFARLTAPEEPEEAEFTLGYITLDAVSNQGESRKPGNLFLNWRKLFDLGPDTVLAGIGAATASAAVQPWAIPLAALYIWNKVWRGAEEPLTEVDACILLALWQNRNSENKITEADGEVHTNALRSKQGLSALSVSEYAKALSRLAKLECIELSDGVVWLREWIKVKY